MRCPLDTASALNHEALSRTGFYGPPLTPDKDGPVIVCAGTSDLPVAQEAARCLMFSGYHAPVIADVGVAGLWRLLERIEEIRSYQVIIAVAGMEGALFSVLGGLVEAPIIAVPYCNRLWRCDRGMGVAQQCSRVLRLRARCGQYRQRFRRRLRCNPGNAAEK